MALYYKGRTQGQLCIIVCNIWNILSSVLTGPLGQSFRGKMFRQRDLLISSAVPVLGIWHKYALEQFQGMHYHCFPTDLPRRYIIFTQHRQLILKNNRQSQAPVLWWHDHVFLCCMLGKQNDFQIGNLYSWKRLCLQKVFPIGQHLCKPNVVVSMKSHSVLQEMLCGR